MSAPQPKWRLALQERQRTPDGAGGFLETWVTLGTLWGEVSARSVGDGDVPGGEASRVRYRITLRAAPETSPARPRIGQRLAAGNRAFLIEAVSERDPAALWLTVWAREEVLA